MERRERAQPVTIISPIHRWWSLWLRTTWKGADRFPPIKRTLVRLSFIHFAHWSLITKMPQGRRGAPPLPHPYLLFQSNFDDDIRAYIDAFSLVVPLRMRAMWQGVFHFPGPRPVDRFLAFIVERTTSAQHYYCAYPEASTKMINAALELAESHRSFSAEAAGLGDSEFAERCSAFLTDNQLRI
jgi:hypothetical protein